MPPFPCLETQRLVLREVVDEDAAALFAVHGNAEHMRWFGVDPPADLEAARRLVSVFASWRSQPNPGTRWALELKAQPGLIGTCGLFAWNRSWKKCALGFELAPEHAGQGFMREALATALTWGFEAMELNRIEAQVHDLNAASLKLLQSLGLVQEGRLREVAYWGGRHHDLLQYSLLKTEWLTRSAT